MPIGPNGERRPSNPIEAGIMAARVASGDIEEEYATRTGKPISNRSAGGKKGGPARAKALSAEERSAIARKGAEARNHKPSAA